MKALRERLTDWWFRVRNRRVLERRLADAGRVERERRMWARISEQIRQEDDR